MASFNDVIYETLETLPTLVSRDSRTPLTNQHWNYCRSMPT